MNLDREFLSQKYGNLKNLVKINLANLEICKIEDNVFTDLTSLKTLNLAKNHISEINETTFSGLENLQDLNLSDNDLTIIKEDSFKSLKNLETLQLNTNKISNITNLSGMNKLTSLNLTNNQLKQIDTSMFTDVFNLATLNLANNQISILEENTFANLCSLNTLLLIGNKMNTIKENAFIGLKNLETLKLYNNHINQIQEKTFNGLTSLTRLELNNNKIIAIHENAFSQLEKLDILYLHQLAADNLSSNLFSALKLSELTLFDERIIKKPVFPPINFVIKKANIDIICGKKFDSPTAGSTYFMSRSSLVSIELIENKWKILQKGFKWENIPTKLSVLIGKNRLGKTTVLELINESLKQHDDQFITNYYSSAENKNFESDFDSLNRSLYSYIFLTKDKQQFTDFLYESINDFSLIQYFDYMLLLNYGENDFKFNLKVFEYRIDAKRINERKSQQMKFLNDQKPKRYDQSWNYFNGIKRIEYYFGLDDEHKFSSGESLILLIELWKIHARKLKLINEVEKRPISNKLRVLLLDEPDAHMHPSLLKDFIEMLRNDELDLLNMQVIMTSHSPISIAFIKKKNILELTKDNDKEITKSFFFKFIT